VSGPSDIVYLDPRVTRTMKAEPEEGLVGYIRQDLYEKDVRRARARDQETIIQILTNPDGRLVGLSTWGRVWAFVAETKEDLPAWILITDQLPAQELDS